jgi:hypothetical protein
MIFTEYFHQSSAIYVFKLKQHINPKLVIIAFSRNRPVSSPNDRNEFSFCKWHRATDLWRSRFLSVRVVALDES